MQEYLAFVNHDPICCCLVHDVGLGGWAGQSGRLYQHNLEGSTLTSSISHCMEAIELWWDADPVISLRQKPTTNRLAGLGYFSHPCQTGPQPRLSFACWFPPKSQKVPTAASCVRQLTVSYDYFIIVGQKWVQLTERSPSSSLLLEHGTHLPAMSH